MPARRNPRQSEFDGWVIAAFGRRFLVRDAGGTVRPARLRPAISAVVCGDEVHCELDPHHAEAHVLAVRPRRTCLYRASGRGGSEPVFANVSLLLVVSLRFRRPDYFVIDRYLCAAASAGIAARLFSTSRARSRGTSSLLELAASSGGGLFHDCLLGALGLRDRSAPGSLCRRGGGARRAIGCGQVLPRAPPRACGAVEIGGLMRDDRRPPHDDRLTAVSPRWQMAI